MHIGATALHYGQACFEGLKAFSHADGGVYLFRPDENGMRINRSANRVMMPEIPVDTFIKACNDVVKDNIAYGELCCVEMFFTDGWTVARFVRVCDDR